MYKGLKFLQIEPWGGTFRIKLNVSCGFQRKKNWDTTKWWCVVDGTCYHSEQVNHVNDLFVYFSLLCSSCLLRPTFRLYFVPQWKQSPWNSLQCQGEKKVDCIFCQLVRFHHMWRSVILFESSSMEMSHRVWPCGGGSSLSTVINNASNYNAP